MSDYKVSACRITFLLELRELRSTESGISTTSYSLVNGLRGGTALSLPNCTGICPGIPAYFSQPTEDMCKGGFQICVLVD